MDAFSLQRSIVLFAYLPPLSRDIIPYYYSLSVTPT